MFIKKTLGVSVGVPPHIGCAHRGSPSDWVCPSGCPFRPVEHMKVNHLLVPDGHLTVVRLAGVGIFRRRELQGAGAGWRSLLQGAGHVWCHWLQPMTAQQCCRLEGWQSWQARLPFHDHCLRHSCHKIHLLYSLAVFLLVLNILRFISTFLCVSLCCSPQYEVNGGGGVILDVQDPYLMAYAGNLEEGYQH